MRELIIKYKDSSGEISERRISGVFPMKNRESIDAFCHLRNAWRTFRVGNIIYAVDVQTGEFIENPWKEFGIASAPGGRETLSSIMPAIKALKFFSKQVRGFAKRERKHILDFIRSSVDTSSHKEEELDEWLHNLWVGDVHAYRNGDTTEYESILETIPSSLIPICREVAIAIARGSGRKPIPQELLERINHEFSGLSRPPLVRATISKAGRD